MLEDVLTARAAMLVFVVGSPLCFLALAALGHAGSAWTRRTRLVVVDHTRTAPDPASAVAPTRTVAPVAPVAPEPTRSTRAVPTIVASIRPPRPVRAPWAPADGLRHPLADGTAPAESTVRKRAWTSYATIADTDLYGETNVERLQRGRPPLRFNPVRDTLETMEVDIDDVGHARLRWPDDTGVDPYEVRA